VAVVSDPAKFSKRQDTVENETVGRTGAMCCRMIRDMHWCELLFADGLKAKCRLSLAAVKIEALIVLIAIFIQLVLTETDQAPDSERQFKKLCRQSVVPVVVFFDVVIVANERPTATRDKASVTRRRHGFWPLSVCLVSGGSSVLWLP
jgi:hypothetical protein